MPERERESYRCKSRDHSRDAVASGAAVEEGQARTARKDILRSDTTLKGHVEEEETGVEVRTTRW